MSVSRVFSAQTTALSVSLVEIETDLSRGLYAFSIIGIPDQAVEEAKDRVGAAIKNSGLTSPKQKNQKIVISLAPASEKKEGAIFDLPIALSYLLASEEIHFDTKNKIFLGELSLDGTSNTTVSSGYFARPVQGGRKTQGLHGHNGVDLGAPIGTPVLASAAGSVIIARSSGYNGGYGLYIVVSHANGTQTLYSHLSAVNVSVGDKVSKGEVIGKVGNSGKSTGPHLHFEVRGAKNPF